MLRLICCWLLLGVLTGCVAVVPHRSVPEAKLELAAVAGYPKHIRFWADEAPAFTKHLIQQRVLQYVQAHQGYYDAHGRYPALHYLAISGGGDAGAFGAGVLNGWSETGERPEFAIVTGVSTGALIAPFAFLGQAFDAQAKAAYFIDSSDNIFILDVWTALTGLLGGPALTDNAPLKQRIKDFVTQDILDAIAEEHVKGRRLFIATTHLEAERGVIWDIGEIANSGREDALDLVHQIMLASSAVPGMFAPVMIDVVVDGQHYQEVHVDGGVTSQLVLYPLKIQKEVVDIFRKQGLERHLTILRNSKIDGEYQAITADVFNVTQRSIYALIKQQGVGDLYRLYLGAQRDGIGYRMVNIPAEFDAGELPEFSPERMRLMYDAGLVVGRYPDTWESAPPGYLQ